MDREIYLDNNATTRPYPEVVDQMVRALRDAANASSAHSAGERARRLVETARESVANLVGTYPETIFFTSGGTEANNTILGSIMSAVPPRRLITTSVEHPSILRMAEKLQSLGVQVHQLPVDTFGIVSIDSLRDALEGPTTLVSIQWVNNETGVVQPIEEIAEICAARGVLLHTDAAQAAGKLSISLRQLPIDYLTLTAHKFRGPQGIGAVVARNPRSLVALLSGGDQETGKRPGTENVAAIVGMGVAAAIRVDRAVSISASLGDSRDRLERTLLASVPQASINGGGAPRVCNTTNVLFAGIDGTALVAHLDRRGIRASQSSACHNQRPEPSHVLTAMGLTERDAYSSVRFSVSEEVTESDIECVAQVASEYCRAYRSRQHAHSEVCR